MFDKARIRWIFFDIGETLVDETKPIRDILEQFIQASHQLGYSFQLQEVEQAMMYYHSQLCEHPMREVMSQLVPSEKHRAEIRQYMKYKKDLEEPFPEAREVLQQLTGLFQMGIIANQNAGTVERLKRYGLLEYFSIVCSSAEDGITKPDPQFFELALERAKCDAQHAVMIGDRLDNDIHPAKRLGMQAIWIKQGLAREQKIMDPLTAPDLVIHGLKELVGILKG
ncbi:HAD family hydrolase [Paenibacillus psychroresistens]|uniref:HAD family hydrolase n=1 Tax=Paenibacillus psychroresistens TaxID=1778678 RepID=A0A6B8RQM8_9BACL|nr:HAD family hydrolase [Paenibacillus psychroresistens]QGQ98012.1 HAD family hydrolase [Paenibacillus psychroresistens]